MACLAAAKLPDCMAFSMARPTELEPLCSVLTFWHMALFGADPLVLAPEWCFELPCADAALIGTSVSATPVMPMQIPCHQRRCFTGHLPVSASNPDATAPVAGQRGIGPLHCPDFVRTGRPRARRPAPG